MKENTKAKLFTLDKLINILSDLRDKENNGEYEVEFWLDDELIEIKSIGHFGVIPNTTMTFTRNNSRICVSCEQEKQVHEICLDCAIKLGNENSSKINAEIAKPFLTEEEINDWLDNGSWRYHSSHRLMIKSTLEFAAEKANSRIAELEIWLEEERKSSRLSHESMINAEKRGHDDEFAVEFLEYMWKNNPIAKKGTTAINFLEQFKSSKLK